MSTCFLTRRPYGQITAFVSLISFSPHLHIMAYCVDIIHVSCIHFSYRGGVDEEGRPVMVVVGAHFLLRCLDLERFVLYVVKVNISNILCDFCCCTVV